MKKVVKIRYNTAVVISEEKDVPTLYWRVLIDGEEHLASDIKINVKSYSTQDFIEGVGVKHHITCESEEITWDEKTQAVTIN